ncbi:hypothetical protein [Nostoc sp.]|uniref:hypothetical protein n=1 Tax=Nostoc sp. TaxID=1180 RepID=UPI002FF7D2EE
MNKYADITKDLQTLESSLQRILESPVYADMVKTGLYNPDLSLLDALHAVQQCLCTTKQIKSIQRLKNK